MKNFDSFSKYKHLTQVANTFINVFRSWCYNDSFANYLVDYEIILLDEIFHIASQYILIAVITIDHTFALLIW